MTCIRCWSCNGNGIQNIVNSNGPWGTEVCSDCKGSGIDEEKTSLYNLEHSEQFILTEITGDQL